MEVLSDQGFSENQEGEALDRGLEDIAIEEGSRMEVRGAILKRSRILRKMAIAHFSDVNGSTGCRGAWCAGPKRNPSPQALVASARPSGRLCASLPELSSGRPLGHG